MSHRYIRMLILVIVLIAVAIYINLPNSPGIHVGEIHRDFETRLGLDLVGGVQALLEADLPADESINAESMSAAVKIVENRVNGLGVTEAVVQGAGDRRIVVELPGETDPEEALAVLQQTGFLEFVDFSEVDPAVAYALVGQKIVTDRPTGDQQVVETSAPVTETVYTTIMTGTDLKNVFVDTSQLNQYQIAFELTPEGSDIFRDFTTNNVGKVLAIALDKEPSIKRNPKSLFG